MQNVLNLLPPVKNGPTKGKKWTHTKVDCYEKKHPVISGLCAMKASAPARSRQNNMRKDLARTPPFFCDFTHMEL